MKIIASSTPSRTPFDYQTHCKNIKINNKIKYKVKYSKIIIKNINKKYKEKKKRSENLQIWVQNITEYDESGRP